MSSGLECSDAFTICMRARKCFASQEFKTGFYFSAFPDMSHMFTQHYEIQFKIPAKNFAIVPSGNRTGDPSLSQGGEITPNPLQNAHCEQWICFFVWKLDVTGVDYICPAPLHQSPNNPP